MLGTFRKYKKSFVGLFTAAIAAMLMLSFGIQDYMSSNQTSWIAKVDDVEIPYQAYYRERLRLTNNYRQQFGESFARFEKMLNISQNAIDKLVIEVVLGNYLNSLELSAGIDQIKQRLSSEVTQYFPEGLTKKSYAQFLQAAGLTGIELEELLRKQIVRKQLIDLLTAVTTPTAVELKGLFNEKEAKYKFRYLTFSAEDFLPSVDTSKEEELKKYIESNREKYLTKKAAEFEFVSFLPADFEKDVEVLEEDLVEAYAEHKREFLVPKQVDLKRVYLNKVEVKKEESLDAVKELTGEKKEDAENKYDPNISLKEKAEALLKEIKPESSFEVVAKLASEKGINLFATDHLGWKDVKQLDEKVRSEIANLKSGEHSSVVEESERYSIYFVSALKEERQKELSEVRTELDRIIRKANSIGYARVAADAFKSQLKAANDLKANATNLGRAFYETGKALSVADSLTNGPQELVSKAIDFGQGISDVVEAGGNFYLLNVKKIVEPALPDFIVLKEKVIEDFKKDRSFELADRRAREVLKSVTGEKEKKSLQEIAQMNSLSIKETPEANRSASTDEIFNAPGLRDAAFSLSAEKAVADKVFSLNGKYYIIEFISRTLPPDADFLAKEKELKSEETNAAGHRLFAALVESLKAKAKIEIKQEML